MRGEAGSLKKRMRPPGEPKQPQRPREYHKSQRKHQMGGTMTTDTPAQARAVALVMLLFASRCVLAQNSASSPDPAVPQVGPKPITVWKVGDPWRGGTPDTAVPPSLELSARKLGYWLRVEAFPIQGFASLFFRSFENHQSPDILVFNNYGVLEGISTPMGSFSGIATDPEIHAALEQVTESLAALEERGWEYLIHTSPNYEAARALALRPPECAANLESVLPAGLSEIATQSATAYLESSPSLRNLEDPDRLHTSVIKQTDATWRRSKCVAAGERTTSLSCPP